MPAKIAGDYSRFPESIRMSFRMWKVAATIGFDPVVTIENVFTMPLINVRCSRRSRKHLVMKLNFNLLKIIRFGLTLAVLALALSLIQPAQAAIWVTNSPMETGRSWHTATLLPNGKVMVAGGEGFMNSAELFNPHTGTWTNTGAMNTGRWQATATLLHDGKVLVAGGYGGSYGALSSAELYNPATGKWVITGSLNVPRRLHTATLLNDGKVLVTGGVVGGDSAELYNPASGTWSLTGSMSTERWFHAATLLPTGKVLVTGGNPPLLSSTELYDPDTGGWTPGSDMNFAHVGHTATLLFDGTLLIAGDAYNGGLSGGELYDPFAGTWTLTGAMTTNRYLHTATLLPNGKVLVAGGDNWPNGCLSSAELYDPASKTWTATVSMNTARQVHTATWLPDGKVLVTGGQDGNYNSISSTEFYDVGLEHGEPWQPQINEICQLTWPPRLENCLIIFWSRFRAVPQDSGGNFQDLPAEYPILQLLSLGNGQSQFLQSRYLSKNLIISAPATNFPPGFAMATLFVNGIPSNGKIIKITSPIVREPHWPNWRN